MADEPKAFEEIKHTGHGDNPTRLETKQCQRCKFDVAENSLTDKIKSLSDKSKSVNASGAPVTFKMLTVVRGRFDDCIGWTIQWR